MKNLKKILGLSLALSMCVSCIPNAFAEETETVTPNVLYWRDYEDYESAGGFYVSKTQYGTDAFDNSNTTLEKNSVAITDYDGVAVNLGVASGGPAMTLDKAISDGKLYIGFDIEKESDEFFDEWDGTENGYITTTETSEPVVTPWVEGEETAESLVSASKPVLPSDCVDSRVITEVYDVTEVYEEEGVMYTKKYTKTLTKQYFIHRDFISVTTETGGGRYLRFGTGHSNVKDTTDSWNDIATITNLPTGYHRVEFVIDFNASKCYTYIDGSFYAEKAYTFGAISKITANLNGNIEHGKNAEGNKTYVDRDNIRVFDNFAMIHYPAGAENTFSIKAQGFDYDNKTLSVSFESDTKTTVGDVTYEALYPVALDDLDKEDTEAVETLADYLTVTNSNGDAVEMAAVLPGKTVGVYDIKLKAMNEKENYTVTAKDSLGSITGAVINGKTVSEYITPECYMDIDFSSFRGENKAFEAPSSLTQNANNQSLIAFDKWGKALKALGGITYAYTFEEPVTTGILNYSFDVLVPTGANVDDANVILYNTSGTGGSGNNGGMRLFYVDAGNSNPLGFRVHTAQNTGNWSYVKKAIENDTLYHIDLVVNIDEGTYMSYVNGEEYAGWTAPSPELMQAKAITMILREGMVIDNLKLSYPKKDEYTIEKASWTNAYAEIKLSEGASADARNIVSDITVIDKKTGEAVEVTAEALGRRIILSGLDSKKSYTVTLPEGYTSVNGKALETNSITLVSKTMLDLDFENYEGVGTAFEAPEYFDYQKVRYQKAVSFDKWGKALKVFLPEGDTWLRTEVKMNMPNLVNEGVLVTSFDFMVEDDCISDDTYVYLQTPDGVGGAGNDGKIRLFYIDGKTGQFRLTKGAHSWSTYTEELSKNTMYHIDLVMDYENGQFTPYINGTAYEGWTADVKTVKASQVNVYTVTGTVLDNVKVAYTDDNSYFIEDALWRGDYAEIKLSEGASDAAHEIVSEVVVTDKQTGEAVEVTAEALGRRIILSGLDGEKSYTVTLPAGYTSITGNELELLSVDLNAGMLDVDVKITSDMSGTELTDDAKATLKAGDKVYAEVSYTNTTGKAKSFVLLGASYADNRMSSANYKQIDAKVSEDVVTEYVEIDVKDINKLSLKAFVWSDLITIMPIANIVK